MLKKVSIVFAAALLACGSLASTGGAQPEAAAPEESAATTQTAPAAQLLAWYKFDENSGVTAFDSSGNGNHAMLVDGAMWDPVVDTTRQYDFGPSAVTFTDTEETELNRVTAPSSASLCVGMESVSISFMLKKTGAEEDHPIVFVAKGSANEGELPGAEGKRYEVFLRDRAMRMALDDNVRKAEAGAKIERHLTGKWIHVVCVADRPAKTFHFYVDGKELPITYTWEGDPDWPNDSLDENTPLVIGNRLPHPDDVDNHTFAGSIDDVRIYKGVLTPEEIEGIYGQPVIPLGEQDAEETVEAQETPEDDLGPAMRFGPKISIGEHPVKRRPPKRAAP